MVRGATIFKLCRRDTIRRRSGGGLVRSLVRKQRVQRRRKTVGTTPTRKDHVVLDSRNPLSPSPPSASSSECSWVQTTRPTSSTGYHPVSLTSGSSPPKIQPPLCCSLASPIHLTRLTHDHRRLAPFLSATDMAHCESISIGAGSRGIGEKTDAAGHGEDKIVFTSPFSTSSNGVLPRDFGRSTHSPTSSSRGSTSRRGSSDSAPGSRRGSHDALTGRGTQAPALPTLGQPVPPHSPTTSHNPIRGEAVDFSRRRSVDVGVLGLGSHRAYGVGSLSKRVREAVGPDAGDKEAGVVGSGPEGGKDRLCVLPCLRREERGADALEPMQIGPPPRLYTRPLASALRQSSSEIGRPSNERRRPTHPFRCSRRHPRLSSFLSQLVQERLYLGCYFVQLGTVDASRTPGPHLLAAFSRTINGRVPEDVGEQTEQVHRQLAALVLQRDQLHARRASQVRRPHLRELAEHGRHRL